MRPDSTARITPVILTLDEAANIRRTLAALSWAREVVVVDSFSQDATEEIVREFPNARFVQRRFDSHATQWNFAVSETGISNEWVLALDADYIVTPELARELRAAELDRGPAAYRTRFRYCVDGQPLRGSVYPPVVTLFRRAAARYRQDGHTQRLMVDGAVGELAAPLLHDDRKPLARWLSAQDRYMALESEKLRSTPWRELPTTDRVRKLLIVAPVLVFLYALFVKGAILDGRAGLHYAVQRAVAEAILSLHLIERAASRRSEDS